MCSYRFSLTTSLFLCKQMSISLNDDDDDSWNHCSHFPSSYCVYISQHLCCICCVFSLDKKAKSQVQSSLYAESHRKKMICPIFKMSLWNNGWIDRVRDVLLSNNYYQIKQMCNLKCWTMVIVSPAIILSEWPWCPLHMKWSLLRNHHIPRLQSYLH